MEFTNTTLLYGLFNQYVFSESKMNMNYLQMYYKDKGLLMGNSLIKSLLKLIEDYKYTDLTESRFMFTLQQDNRTVDEAKMIYDKIRDYQTYTKDQASVFIDNLRSMCYTGYVDRMQKLYGDDPVTYVNKLKDFDYKSNFSDTLMIKKFSELDVTDLVNRYSGEGYKSRFKFINEAYHCGGYIPGQLILVCGAPATGKSLWMQSECVNFITQGKRCHYLAMGDLNELDLAIRMMEQITMKSQREIESDILGNFDLYKNLFGERLALTVVPSGSVSARDYVDWMKQMANDFDVLFIDYYSNFAANEDRSMYQNGGDICDALTELTREGKLVFMACQPNKSFFNDEYLPYEAIGESSRLPHIADMIITIGINRDAGMRLGKMHIAKNRRGNPEANRFANWIGTREGLFYIASDMLYTKYRCDKTTFRLYTYSDLQAMDVVEEVTYSNL